MIAESVQPASEQHLRLAGFALAHGLGSIDGGGTLCTLAFVKHGKQRDLIRYEAVSIPESVAIARHDLRKRLAGGGEAALVYDGYTTVDRVRWDALMVELVEPDGTVVAQLAQRYRPGRSGLFSLLRPIGIRVPGGLAIIGDPIAMSTLPPDAPVAFSRGLADHPYGRRAYGLSRDATPAT